MTLIELMATHWEKYKTESNKSNYEQNYLLFEKTLENNEYLWRRLPAQEIDELAKGVMEMLADCPHEYMSKWREITRPSVWFEPQIKYTSNHPCGGICKCSGDKCTGPDDYAKEFEKNIRDSMIAVDPKMLNFTLDRQ
jgi:hypothetical protein